MRVAEEIGRFAASRNPAPPMHLGQRYDPTRFLPEAGNTVVCHLDTSAPAHRAVLEARARMRALAGAERFLFTPEASLHMTVFEGAIETRRTADAWPEGMDHSASIESVTQALIPRLAAFTPPPRFRVRVAGLRPTGLALTGATPEDDAHMQAWRDRLTEPFGYRHASHDAYRFHMTFAYPLAWLPDDVLGEWETEVEAILADLARAAPVIPLTAPAFCSFADMTHFEPLVVLGD